VQQSRVGQIVYRGAPSESSLTAVQVDLLHGGFVLLLAAALLVLGYALFVAFSVLVAGVRKVGLGRSARRTGSVDAWSGGPS